MWSTNSPLMKLLRFFFSVLVCGQPHTRTTTRTILRVLFETRTLNRFSKFSPRRKTRLQTRNSKSQLACAGNRVEKRVRGGRALYCTETSTMSCLLVYRPHLTIICSHSCLGGRVAFQNIKTFLSLSCLSGSLAFAVARRSVLVCWREQ